MTAGRRSGGQTRRDLCRAARPGHRRRRGRRRCDRPRRAVLATDRANAREGARSDVPVAEPSAPRLHRPDRPERGLHFVLFDAVAPPNAENDPTHLNENWPNNVRKLWGVA